MSTLAQLRARVQQALVDTGAAVFAANLVDEALRQALHEYSGVAPLAMETVIRLPGDGREIALDGVSGLLGVTNVWWPYYSDSDEEWPPNRVRAWRVWWDDARPVLFLSLESGDQPQKDDEVRLWYVVMQTVQDLDSAAATSVPASDETILVRGGEGYALLARSLDLAEDTTLGTSATPNYGVLAAKVLADFRRQLEGLRRRTVGRGEPWGAGGWRMDKWDE